MIFISIIMWRKSQKSLGKTEAIGQYGTNVASVLSSIKLREDELRSLCEKKSKESEFVIKMISKEKIAGP